MKRHFLWVGWWALGGCSNLPGECSALVELCLDASDAGDADAQDCIDYAEADGRTGDQCTVRYDECEPICNGG